MAASPAHTFGQYLGNVLEALFLPELTAFCDGKGLYVDCHGERPGIRTGKKATWTDKYGNKHDLDFVIEKNASATVQGRPLAFIEAAWRRYTKHSRNKAQEIQGAVLPIAEKYAWDKPFLGAVLAGHFTAGSLQQLDSMGFHVVYIPYTSMVQVYKKNGIDIVFDESTPEEHYTRILAKITAGGQDLETAVITGLRAAHRAELDDRLAAARMSLPLTRGDFRSSTAVERHPRHSNSGGGAPRSCGGHAPARASGGDRAAWAAAYGATYGGISIGGMS